MKNAKRNRLTAICMVLTVILLIIIDNIFMKEPKYPLADSIIKPFADSHSIKMKKYPDELKELLEKNPETEEFVLYYPIKKDLNESFSLDEYKNCTEIPYFMQWDTRWGYYDYAGSIIGIAGCGPTCLSMAAIYLLQDIKFDPLYISRFAEKENYATENNGTKWLLMSEGAEKLGLKAEELPLHKETMISALEEGRPIICIMGAGDFTSSGHYIVLTDYSEEGFSVLDPNSRSRSEKKWSYERMESQIRNIWAYSLPE